MRRLARNEKNMGDERVSRACLSELSRTRSRVANTKGVIVPF